MLKLRELRYRPPWIVACVLIAASALDVSTIVVRMRSHDRTAPAAPVRLSALPRVNGAARTQLSTIIASHLFGRQSDPSIDAAVTEAGLLLAGTIASDNSKQGFCILKTPTSGSHLYATGANVAPATVLYQVFRDHVILQRSGQLERLSFARKSAPPALAATIAPPSHLSAPENGTGVPPGDAGGDGSAPPPDRANVVLAKLNAYAVTDNSGRFLGYQVNPFPKVRRDWGVRPGDRLMEINGADVRTKGDVQAALEGDASSPVTLTVQRDGQLINLSVTPDLSAGN
jgi:type II secretion system protein C